MAQLFSNTNSNNTSDSKQNTSSEIYTADETHCKIYNTVRTATERKLTNCGEKQYY